MTQPVFEAIILGIVQGIAEFLPVSSSGHLVIVDHLLFPDADLSQSAEKLELNIALHLGTLFSILVVYRKDLWAILYQPRQMAAIVIATIPIVIIGLTLKDQIESAFNTPLIAGCGLLVTATLLFLTRFFQREESDFAGNGASPSLFKAVLIGAFQAIAIVPGISRSGSTITGGLLVGLTNTSAARFSFLIAIPAISGAAILSGKDMLEEGKPIENLMPLFVGLVTAFIVGLVSLNWLLKLITKGRLHWFAPYCATVGIATIIWQLLAA